MSTEDLKPLDAGSGYGCPDCGDDLTPCPKCESPEIEQTFLGVRPMSPDLQRYMPAMRAKLSRLRRRVRAEQEKATAAGKQTIRDWLAANTNRVLSDLADVTGELETELDEAHAAIWGLICAATNAEGRASGFRAWMDIEMERRQKAEAERDEARAELARLTTPRPIAEAPKDGAWIGAIWEDMDAEDCQRYGPIAVVKWRGTGWEDSDGDGYEPPSHFLPLPVLP